MRGVPALVARAAGDRGGVLLRGEEGTGRELVARAIHEAAGASAPFVVVDCSGAPDRVERELFGAAAHEAAGSLENVIPGTAPPAPTALERVARSSAVCRASGGTLYLRSLEEAPARQQRRLARILRDQEAALLETGETVSIDVRPMAGVSPGIDADVEEGRLIRGLVLRLADTAIDLPPLSRRREDIPALADHLLREICGTNGRAPLTLTPPSERLIVALPWRGNARELRAALERVVAGHAGGNVIAFEELLALVRFDAAALPHAASDVTLRQARIRFEREYVSAVLAQHEGRIAEAARTLGIQRTNLYRKMKSLRVARQNRTQ